MAKTVIDIDEDLLDSAREILGTTTKKDTVNAALREVADRRRRESAVDALVGLDFLAELIEPGFEDRAWRT